MSERISEYTTSVTALASGDLMDVSKLISTSPLEYQSQKLNYSVLLTELNADLTINNLAKADLTSTAAARSFYLYGNTGSDSLRFRSLAGNPMLSLFGSGGVVIGNATTYGALQIYLSASDANGDTYYRNAGGNVQALGIGTAGQVLTVSGGGLPSWAAVSASNLGSANLTSTDDARTFTLKSGGTATQNLQFLNSGGGNLLTLYGNKNIEFGSSSNLLTEFLINLSGTAGTFRMASGSNAYAIYYDAPAFNFSIRSATSYKVDIFGGLGSIYSTGDTSSGYYVNKLSGTTTAALYNNNGSNFYMANSAGTRLINIESVNGFGHVIGGWAVGLSYSIVPTARLHVKGSGATSATTTALFENSSSVACLTIKDDLTSTFGGTATAPQIITTPATITVAANAGTVTRANRINKFTNSSAATMTITMSTTAALDGDLVQVRIYDFSAATQTITWVNTENSSVTVPATSNGSTTLYLTVGFQYNSATSKWRCIGSV